MNLSNFLFINFTGKIPSKFHMQYLKSYNDAKEKSGTNKWAAFDQMLSIAGAQSNDISSLAKSYQMSIQMGMESTCQTDIQHSTSSILDMGNTDFFVVRIYLIMLLNLLSLKTLWTSSWKILNS